MCFDLWMIASDILSWYEASLPAPERKMRGHFSTPPLLVERILDACGYTPEHDLSYIRVLDPACGSGNFLAGALRRLIAFGHRANLTSKELAPIIQRNIRGFDPDPISCFLSDLQLRILLSTSNARSDSKPPPRRSDPYRSLPLHIHQADGLAIPWEQCQNIDLFLANPPYLAAKNNDLSAYRAAWQQGQADSYLLFLKLALQVVRPGGWIGLVLPDPVLVRSNAAKERQLLLRETTIHHLWHLSGVFAAYVGAVVLVAQKCLPQRLHRVSWVRGRWQYSMNQETATTVHTGAIAQSLLYRQPDAEMRYLLSEAHHSPQHALLQQLHNYLREAPANGPCGFAPLSDFVSIRRGEELSKNSSLLMEAHPADENVSGRPRGIIPPMDDRVCEASPNHWRGDPSWSLEQAWYPVLRGGVDVRAYTIPTGHYWIARSSVRKPLERYLAPKLLVVKSTGRLQATLDLQGHIVLQTLYMLDLRTENPALHEDELYFLLALLNSRLLRTYVYTLYTAYKWVQPQMEQHVLAHLPVPTADASAKERIVKRAKLLLRACSKIPAVVELKEQEIYEEQERAICALYTIALQDGESTLPSLQTVDKGVTLYG